MYVFTIWKMNSFQYFSFLMLSIGLCDQIDKVPNASKTRTRVTKRPFVNDLEIAMQYFEEIIFYSSNIALFGKQTNCRLQRGFKHEALQTIFVFTRLEIPFQHLPVLVPFLEFYPPFLSTCRERFSIWRNSKFLLIKKKISKNHKGKHVFIIANEH
jgi:hypothetical protein